MAREFTAADGQRHKAMITLLLSNVTHFQKVDGNTWQPNPGHLSFPQGNWPWGNLGKRIGGSRSADGALFELPNAPRNITGGNNVVLKFLFSRGTQNEEECRLSKVMSDAKLGPHVYGLYTFPVNLRQFTDSIFREHPGLLKNRMINIFDYYNRHGGLPNSGYNRAYIIIMEHLFDNPRKGVVAGKTFNQLLQNSRGWTVPIAEIERKINAMHRLGIVHADMHPGNIVISKIEKNGKVRFGIKIIDFGRSFRETRPLINHLDAHRALRARGITEPSNLRQWEYLQNQLLRTGRHSINTAPGSRFQNFNASRQRSQAAMNWEPTRRSRRNSVSAEIRARYNTPMGQQLNMDELNNFLAERDPLPNYENRPVSRHERQSSGRIPFPTYSEIRRWSP